MCPRLNSEPSEFASVTTITEFCDVRIPILVPGLRMISAEMRTTAEILLK
jgi:hypothetical protein